MSRLRRPVRLVLAAAAVALALPANVAPATADVAVREYAETSLNIVARNGVVYRLFVGAYGPDEVDARPPSAVVRITHCTQKANTTTCVTLLDARVAIPAAAFTVGPDLSSAKLTTSFRGLPLSVTWTATAPPPVAPGIQAWFTPTVRLAPQRQGLATVAFLGARCSKAPGVVAHETTVSTTDLHAATKGEIPAVLRGTPAPRCEV